MTDPEALPDEDLSMSCDTDRPYDTTDRYTEPDYADADWDSYPIDDWAVPPAEQAQPPATPWFGNPRLLFGLISVAAAALVVATVLLITGKESGEIPTTPQLSTRTTPSALSTPRVSSEPGSSTPAAASSPSAESSSVSTEETAAPAEPEQSAEPPAAAPPPPPSASPAGPKMNVTRTPMSFTPGKH